jgi:PAS domain S-box-containing protein
VSGLEAELAEAREQLQRAQELQRYAVELSQQMVWTADAQGRLTYAGRRFFELLQAKPSLPPHEAWMMLLHPDDHAVIEQAWLAARRSNAPHSAEFRLLRPDGSYGIFLARTAPKLDEAGEIVCWYGMTEDVTEPRRMEAARAAAEEQLRTSEERHRYTLELIDQIVWTAEADGSDPKAAPRFYELTGLPPGTRPREAIHPDDLPAVMGAWQHSLRTGLAHHHEFRLRLRDGSLRHFRARAAPRRDAEGRVIRWLKRRSATASPPAPPTTRSGIWTSCMTRSGGTSRPSACSA